jgi:hypothetical protein
LDIALVFKIPDRIKALLKIIQSKLESNSFNHIPYPVLRSLLNATFRADVKLITVSEKIQFMNAILENTTLMVTEEDIYINAIVKHTGLMITEECIEKAKEISKEWDQTLCDQLRITVKMREKQQSTWDLRQMTGAPEEVVDTTASEEVVEHKNTSTPNDNGKKPAQKQSNYNFGPVLAPLALNLLLHAVHNIIPVYYSSIAAIGVAYICKRKSETQHTKLYNNTMLASAANLCLFSYLNSESELVQAGSLIGIVVASYQYYQINKDQSINAPEL